LLACRGRTLPPVLVVFVGFFENNGFVERSGGLDVVGIPAELAETQRPLTMAREFTQLVHRWKARLSGRRERRVARAVVSEGLAMHAGAALVPGRTVEEYVMEPESGWWASCVHPSRTRCPAAPVTSAPGEWGPREARRTGSATLAPRARGPGHRRASRQPSTDGKPISARSVAIWPTW